LRKEGTLCFAFVTAKGWGDSTLKLYCIAPGIKNFTKIYVGKRADVPEVYLSLDCVQNSIYHWACSIYFRICRHSIHFSDIQ
jgi:hypothetical protein